MFIVWFFLPSLVQNYVRQGEPLIINFEYLMILKNKGI